MRFAKVGLATGPEINFAEHGASGGEPIIFLHGWPDSWFSFSAVASSLPSHYRSFLLDQRGFGDSQRPPQGYAPTDFAADVVAFMDALSLPAAIVVGHSFGSFVARQAAIAAPQRVARLVLIGSGWSARNAVTSEVQATLRELGDPVPEQFAREFQASTICKPVPDAFFERLVSRELQAAGTIVARRARQLARLRRPRNVAAHRSSDAADLGRARRAFLARGSGGAQSRDSTGKAARLRRHRPLAKLGMPRARCGGYRRVSGGLNPKRRARARRGRAIRLETGRAPADRAHSR